jgi:hypothetical protein
MDVNAILDNLAAKLAIPVEYLVSAHAAKGVTEIVDVFVYLSLTFVACFSFARLARKARVLLKEAPDGDYAFNACFWPFCIGVLLWWMSALFAGALKDFILWYINPESYAITTLLEGLK